MRAQQLDVPTEKTHILVFDIGDEVMAGLESFARQHQVTSAHFTAIGAFSDVTLGYFDWDTKQYTKIPIKEQVEVLVLAGDIALKDNQPKVHAHVVLGKADGTAHGGHLLEAHVRPTLEVILNDLPAHLHKQIDERVGLAVIKPQGA